MAPVTSCCAGRQKLEAQLARVAPDRHHRDVTLGELRLVRRASQAGARRRLLAVALDAPAPAPATR